MHITTNQKGNALFLILIGVVLFAALSYAITQSNRSGGNSSSEVNAIAAASVMQYADSMHSGAIRMMLQGWGAADIYFQPPGDPDYETYKKEQLFHPEGGNVSYQNVDPNTVELDANNAPVGAWIYTGDRVIPGLGSSSYDITVLLTHVRKGICEALNEKITGSKAIPDLGLTLAVAVAGGGGATFTGPDIDGHPFLCVATTDNPVVYVYYHVVAEQ